MSDIMKSLVNIINNSYKGGAIGSLLGGAVGSAFFATEDDEHAAVDVACMVFISSTLGITWGAVYGIANELKGYFVEQDNHEQEQSDITPQNVFHPIELEYEFFQEEHVGDYGL